MKDDLDNYKRLMIETNSICRDNDPNENNPKGNRRGHKLNNFTKNILDNRKKYEGTGVIVIPSDPNALLERLDLLLATQEAGHELVSIRDELKRQGVLDTKDYKKLTSIIKI